MPFGLAFPANLSAWLYTYAGWLNNNGAGLTVNQTATLTRDFCKGFQLPPPEWREPTDDDIKLLKGLRG